MSAKIQKHRWLEQLLPPSTDRRLVILTGARQTGKTTLAKKKYSGLRYINLDAEENREAVRGIATFAWAGTVGNAVLDEAQKEPAVFDKVKYAYDEGSISFSVLLGSSQILLMQKIRETLAGRAFVYELWPLMTSELLLDAGREPPGPILLARILDADNLDECLEAIPGRLLGETEFALAEADAHMLRWGGMPELIALEDAARGRWLSSYVYTYLERDLADLVRLADLEPFKKCQRLAALRSSNLRSYSSLARDAGVSADTARRYLEYLRLSYQVFFLPFFSRNLTSTVIKTPKLFFSDVGVMRQLAGFQGEATDEIFETMVVAEIHKWVRSTGAPCELYFYRTRSGMEVDLLIETPRGIVGVEIKNRETVDAADCRSMREVAAALGDEWAGGLCVHRGKTIERLGDPALWAVPSFRLFGV
jgi:predicted AAA+ superfamily ATPase